MKRLVLTTAALSLAALLTACGQKEPAKTEAAAAPAAVPAASTAPTEPAANMAAMGMSADSKMAKGTGTVTAIDLKAGTITLDHGPIPEANWPAMTMAFKVSPTIVGQVKTGETVDFDLKMEGGAGEITAIRKP